MCDTQKSAIGGNVLRGAALVLAALAFVRPQESVQGALDGLSMCARQVIPALFPLMVLSQLLLTSGAAAMFAFPLRAYTRVLGVCSPSAGSAVALGWLGGFACGAQQIGSLRRQEVITRRDAELLLCCTIGSGPAFVVNAVGTLMLGSTLCGALLLTSLLAANLVTGTVMSRILKCGSHPGRPAAFARADVFSGRCAFRGGSHAHAVRICRLFFLCLPCFLSAAIAVFSPVGRGGAARSDQCLPNCRNIRRLRARCAVLPLPEPSRCKRAVPDPQPAPGRCAPFAAGSVSPDPCSRFSGMSCAFVAHLSVRRSGLCPRADVDARRRGNLRVSDAVCRPPFRFPVYAGNENRV